VRVRVRVCVCAVACVCTHSVGLFCLLRCLHFLQATLRRLGVKATARAVYIAIDEARVLRRAIPRSV
jgi:hypothetical protein